MGLARCLAAQGKTDEAVKRLSAAAAGQADVQAELARLAFERGDYKEARTRADEALRLDRRQISAQWIAAELDRTAGRLDEADRAYRRLVAAYNAGDVKQAESLRWIGLAAAQNARWNRLSDQFDLLVNELYPDALKLEPDYWPAHYEAGMLFLEKYNRADAAREFRAALEINPNAAEVHAAMAALAFDGRDIEAAERSLARALEINPAAAGRLAVEGRSAVGELPGRRDAEAAGRQGLAAEPARRSDARPHGGVLRAAGRKCRTERRRQAAVCQADRPR